MFIIQKYNVVLDNIFFSFAGSQRVLKKFDDDLLTKGKQTTTKKPTHQTKKNQKGNVHFPFSLMLLIPIDSRKSLF